MWVRVWVRVSGRLAVRVSVGVCAAFLCQYLCVSVSGCAGGGVRQAGRVWVVCVGVSGGLGGKHACSPTRGGPVARAGA